MLGHFGPYELLSRLGTGGMAETFAAVRRGPGGFEQHVCIKRILPNYEEDEGFIQLFMREARVSARLHHSNIAQVVDFGVVDGSHFLALELVTGADLRALLGALNKDNQRMDPSLVVHLAYELGAALDFAHAADDQSMPAGIVHRDISASNVLLSWAGEIKLTDFGIAKAMNSPETIQSGTIKGKVPYMAPEYATRGDFDARSDLFSLGVVLYEALVGHRPFDGSSYVETLRRIEKSEFEPLVTLVPSAPAPFARLIDSMLCAKPGDRPKNAGAFLDALAGTFPSATARRDLGNLVRKYCPPGASPAQSIDVTLHMTPEGTMVLPDDGSAAAEQSVEAAAPDAETRTRLVPGLEDDDREMG